MAPVASASYLELLRAKGFARLALSLLLGRLGGQMLLVALVLFTLSSYHSPELAGGVAALSILPGLLISPLMGALLDRHSRARLILLDYLLGALCLFSLALLANHFLPPALLLTIVAVASLTNPLSATGTRALFPLLTPTHLWERANAFDSACYIVSILLGAPLAAFLFSIFGAQVALGATAGVFALGAIVLLRLREPRPVSTGKDSIWHQSLQSLSYVLRHPTLRGLALVFFAFNLAWGILVIAIPVLVLSRLHQPASTVGVLWGAMGLGGLISALLVGRIPSLHRERTFIFLGILLSALAILLLPFAFSLSLVALAIIIYGFANGPLDVGMITLRQRTTDPAWFGRAFAVSMSVNWVGTPIGSALVGLLIVTSVNLALGLAFAVCLVALALVLLVIPAPLRGEGANLPGPSI